MLIYDIPGRTGRPWPPRPWSGWQRTRGSSASRTPRATLSATSQVLARTDLAYYCGDDLMNLPWLSIGAVGFISVTGHVVGDRMLEMIEAFADGRQRPRPADPLRLLPVNVGLFRNQAAVMTKAALDLLGLPGGGVRGPLLAASDAERQQLSLTSPRAASSFPDGRPSSA